MDARVVVGEFLSAYRGNTLKNYTTDIEKFLAWIGERNTELLEVRRPDIQQYRLYLEDRGLSPATVGRHLTSIAGLFNYAEQEEYINKSPARFVKRPRAPKESTSEYLDRQEMTAYLAAAEWAGPMNNALVCLLMLNGLRVSEAIGAQISDLGVSKGHRTLDIIGKGNKPATVPMAPRTARAVLMAVGERNGGPILLNRFGRPMSRHNASRITHAIARQADIPKDIGPHALRHSFCTMGLEVGIPIRDMQNGMRHADPKTTSYYDRSRFNLDKHPTYTIAAFVAGG